MATDGGGFAPPGRGIFSSGYDPLPLTAMGDPQEAMRTRRRTQSALDDPEAHGRFPVFEYTPQWGALDRVTHHQARLPPCWWAKTRLHQDTCTLLGWVDARRLPKAAATHDAASATNLLGARYRDHLHSAVLSGVDGRGTGRNRRALEEKRVRLAGNPESAAASRRQAHNIVLARDELRHIVSIRLLPWWTQISSEVIRKRLEKMHQHRYHCREPHCGQATTALLALGQWHCKARFSVRVCTIRSVSALSDDMFHFYVRADCCPPVFHNGWHDRPYEILDSDVIESMPPGIRPQEHTLIDTSVQSAGESDGSVRVKRVFNVRRYDMDVVRSVVSLSEMVSSVAELKRRLLERYELTPVSGFDGRLITPKGVRP